MTDQQTNTSHISQDKNDGESHEIDVLQKCPLPENSDCLEHIFMNLDLKSLLNVGESSKFFQECAASVFKSKFGQSSVIIHSASIDRDYQNDNNIDISDLKTIFSLLRVFGTAISNLDVNFNSGPVQSNGSSIDSNEWRINEYINRYCVDTVSSLAFYDKPKLSNDYEKPFINVQRISMWRTYLKEQLMNFAYCFPKLQELNMFADSIEAHHAKISLPQLTNLEIKFAPFDSYETKSIQLQNFGEFFKANPQLQSICIRTKCPAKVLFKLISANAELRNFRAIFSDNNIGLADWNRFIDQHPQLINISIYGSYNFENQTISTLIRRLKSLKKMELTSIGGSERDEFFASIERDWFCRKDLQYMKFCRK